MISQVRTEAKDSPMPPLNIALAVSIGMHLLALILLEAPMPIVSGGGDQSFVPIDLAKLETVSVSQNGVFSMQGLSAQDQAAEQVARAKREAYLTYLEQVSDAIHRHRLDAGDTTLIGLVLYSFDINENGQFERIVLRRTSGNPALDLAARRAIVAASGEIKRPRILGTKALTVFEEIRFQYTLQ